MAREGKLAKASAHKLAAAIRAAIGAGPDEEVSIKFPQFERPAGAPPPMEAPGSWEMFDYLRTLSDDELRTMGLGRWSKETRLWLLPVEWYDQIPEGYPLGCIDGRTEYFRHGKTDKDIRGGFIAFGIMQTIDAAEVEG